MNNTCILPRDNNRQLMRRKTVNLDKFNLTLEENIEGMTQKLRTKVLKARDKINNFK